jgi:hypothetical protein
MIATGLPVFSVARAALPETVGRSGGAFRLSLQRIELRFELLQAPSDRLMSITRNRNQARELVHVIERRQRFGVDSLGNTLSVDDSTAKGAGGAARGGVRILE